MLGAVTYNGQCEFISHSAAPIRLCKAVPSLVSIKDSPKENKSSTKDQGDLAGALVFGK